jgi:hypothetical protein
MPRFSHFNSVAVPPLPGARYTLSTWSDKASFHAIACSLPPEPITSIFIYLLYNKGKRVLRGKFNEYFLAGYFLFQSSPLIFSGFTFNHEKHEMYEKKTTAKGRKRMASPRTRSRGGGRALFLTQT